jgi:Flp pilus assembly protein TadB
VTLPQAVVVASVCSGTCVLVWPRARPADLTLRRLGHGRAESRAAIRRGPRRRALGGRSVSALAAVAAWLVVGGPAGIAAAVVGLVLLPRWLARLEPAAQRDERLRIAGDLPLAVELLAACLSAGGTPVAALATVASAVGGPLGLRLGSVAATMRLGADPAVAWAEVGADPVLAGLARAVVRSLDSGAAMGPTLDRAARDLRSRRRTTSEAAARAVAVKAAAPLGACFLPAFVLLGIVPTVWGVASRAFGIGG